MARCESSWDANSTILTRSKVRARCWASERYAYPHPLEIPVGVTSTSANRTSPANNPDNQLSHPASHYGPIETGKRKPPARSTHGHTQIRPLPSSHDRSKLGLLRGSDCHWTGTTELVPCLCVLIPAPAPALDLLPPGGHHHSERDNRHRSATTTTSKKVRRDRLLKRPNPPPRINSIKSRYLTS